MFILAGITSDSVDKEAIGTAAIKCFEKARELCTSIGERENADIATSQIEETRFMKGSRHQQRGDVMSNFFSNSIDEVLALPMGWVL